MRKTQRKLISVWLRQIVWQSDNRGSFVLSNFSRKNCSLKLFSFYKYTMPTSYKYILQICTVMIHWLTKTNNDQYHPRPWNWLIESITTLWKGQGNPIRVSMICNPRRGLSSRGCCKSWTQEWDSLVPSAVWWLNIFLPCLLFLINNPISTSF